MHVDWLLFSLLIKFTSSSIGHRIAAPDYECHQEPIIMLYVITLELILVDLAAK